MGTFTMARDKDGMCVEKGMIVFIPCRVVDVDKNERLPNLALETMELDYPSKVPTGIAINSRQVLVKE